MDYLRFTNKYHFKISRFLSLFCEICCQFLSENSFYTNFFFFSVLFLIKIMQNIDCWHYLWPVFSLLFTCHCVTHFMMHTNTDIWGLLSLWRISYAKRSGHQNILRGRATLRDRRLELALRPRALPAATASAPLSTSLTGSRQGSTSIHDSD